MHSKVPLLNIEPIKLAAHLEGISDQLLLQIIQDLL